MSQAVTAFQAYLQKFAPHDFWLQTQLRFELSDVFQQQKQKAKSKKQSKTNTNSNSNREHRNSFKFTKTVDVWHRVLGVFSGALRQEVKSRYRELARSWHPDMCKDESVLSTFEAKMKEINNAYEEFERVNR